MHFSQDFWNDVEEAYAYLASKNQKAPDVTPVQWAARILSQTVYALLAEKRALNAEEKGRQGEADAH
jgi:hypothetical protein